MVEEWVDVGKLVDERRGMESLQKIHQMGAPVEGWGRRGCTGAGEAWRGLNTQQLPQVGSWGGERVVDGRRVGLLGQAGGREASH